MKQLSTLILTIVLISFLGMVNANAGPTDEEYIKNTLPTLLGANNAGKEFWLTIPPCFEDESGGHDNFVRIYVTSPVETLVKIEVQFDGYYQVKKTIPNDVIEFKITPAQGQPYLKSGYQECVAEAVYKNKGIHITADQPLVVYVVVRYYATSDGYLAIPVSSLGTEYICASYPDMTLMFPSYTLPSLCGIVGAYDNTKVLFKLGGNNYTKTPGGMKPGDVVQATLNKGDVWMFSSDGPEGDLTGSKIVSNLPVAVVSGNQCTNIPTSNQWCDYTVEMDLPTYSWGYDYHVVKVPKRAKPSLVRIFAKEPNTSIYRDGKSFGFIAEAGGKIGDAYIETRMVSGTPRSCVFSGNKPIGVTLYNCGIQEDNSSSLNSDPFVMAITPNEQFQKEITFCTPGISGTGFPENYVNLVFELDEYGLMPDDLEFASVNGGEFNWVKIKSKFGATFETFSYDVKGKKYGAKTLDNLGEGVFKIRAKKPFAAYSFGYSFCDSYGYPTSAAFIDILKNDTLPPVPTWTMDCDGTVPKAGEPAPLIKDYPEEDSVRSNLSMIVFNSELSYNYSFNYKDFIAGTDRQTTWTLTVDDKTKDAVAVITFSDRRGNDTTITINYSAIKLSLKPALYDFGLKRVGDVASADFVLKNESDKFPALIQDINLKYGNKGFTLDLLGKTLPFSIAAGESIPLKVTFTATTEGSFQDSVGVGDTCFFAYRSLVKANVGEPIIEVTDLDFDKISVGKTVNKEMEIFNHGSTNLEITGYTGPSLSVYTTDLPEISTTKPLVIEPNKSFLFKVYFTPTDSILYSDKIEFTSNATKTDNIGYINGRGIKALLDANSYDWGKRRIDRPSHDIPAYPADGSYKIITLENKGNEPVYLTGLTITKDVNGSAFEFNRAVFNGLTIGAGKTEYVEVKFHPTQVGEHELVFGYANSAGSTVQTTLKGIGILPQLITQDVNFDTTVINDVANQVTRKVKFTNVEYEWQDNVTITDLVSDAKISTDLTSFGTEGFKYEKSSLNLPVTLIPGQSIEFDAFFVAQKTGDAAAQITTVSDAEAEVTSHWTAFGLSRLVRGTGGEAKLCVGDEAIINCEIENFGTDTLKISSINTDPMSLIFSFVNVTDKTGFKLAPGAKRTVQIKYSPSAADIGVSNAELVVLSNSLVTPELRIPIKGEAVHYTRTAKVSLTEAAKNPIITEVVPMSIVLEGGDDISMASITELNVKLTWEGSFIKALDNEIRIGDALNGKFELIDLSTETHGQITFKLRALGTNILTQQGEIAKLSFITFLPTSVDITDSTNFTLTVETNGSSCVEIKTEGNELKLKRTCAYDMRWIMKPTENYSFSLISPNPVGASGTELNFSIGIEAWTELSIYDSRGNLVAMPVANTLKPGKYSLKLPVTEFSNGGYWLILQSGPYKEQRDMMISK